MTDVEALDPDELRAWLEHVRRTETTRWLMVGIAVAEGVPVEDVADWYDLDSGEVSDWVGEMAAEPLTVSVATREGVDVEALAEASGLGRRTIVDWFAALEDRPIEEAADIVHRYSQRSTGPLLSGTRSRVQYLDYEALVDQGWSIDDEDLFEKASRTDLSTDDYGRFLVSRGETILQAAESRGIPWPYACRGGACANCAVVVVEGDVAMPGQTILDEDQVQRLNARLTCVGVPVTEELKLVKNVQHLDELSDLRLPSPMAESGTPL